MLSRDEYDPGSQFFCYLCGRIKDKADHPSQPILFRIGSAEYTACHECSNVLDSLRRFKPDEKHPVLRDSEWVMVIGD